MVFEGVWNWFAQTMGFAQKQVTVYPPLEECEVLHTGPVWSHVVHPPTGQEYAMLEMDFPVGEGAYGSRAGDFWKWTEHMRSKVYCLESRDKVDVSERVVQLTKELREKEKEHFAAMDAVYRERAMCNQLIVAMSKALGAVGGVRAASLKESREWPVVFARIPMIDPHTKQNFGEHEVSWHIKSDNMLADIEDFGIVDLEWDKKPNEVTYDRVKQLALFFLHIANKNVAEDDDNKNKPE